MTPLSLLVWLGVAAPLLAQIPVSRPRSDIWSTDGHVESAVVYESTLYVTGQFTRLGHCARGFGVASIDSADPEPRIPGIGGEAWAVIADGAGGWYLGGDLGEVGGLARNYLAHVDGFGAVTPWAPPGNGRVYVLHRVGTVVYAGGENGLLAFDAASGDPSPAPAVNGPVFALTSDAARLYVGGSFSTLGGQSRSSLGAVELTTGEVASWAPALVGHVKALALDGQALYVGGLFSNAGGQARSNLAALSIQSGLATAFTAPCNGDVDALSIASARVYAIGGFTQAAGHARGHGAAFDLPTGAITAWDPNLVSPHGPAYDPEPHALIAQESRVYIAGWIGGMGGETRGYAGAVNPESGVALPWNPGVSDATPSVRVRALAIGPSGIGIAGLFTVLGGEPRPGAAAVDLVSGTLLPWTPEPPAQGSWGRSVAVGTDGVFISWLTPSAPGRRLLGYAHSTAQLLPDFVPFHQDTDTLLLRSGELCMPCQITAGYGLCALSAVNGDLLWFAPLTSGFHEAAFNFDGSLLLMAIGSQLRALDMSTHLLRPWAVTANQPIRSISSDGSIIFIAGDFSSVAGSVRPHLAALQMVNNIPVLQEWSVTLQGNPGSLELAATSNAAYISGSFVGINSSPPQNLGGVSRTSANACTWDPRARGTGKLTRGTDHLIMYGGPMTFGATYRHGLAVFDLRPCPADPNQDCIINVADFTAFLQLFAAGALAANCDGSTLAPVLNVADFTCFLQEFASGCP